MFNYFLHTKILWCLWTAQEKIVEKRDLLSQSSSGWASRPKPDCCAEWRVKLVLLPIICQYEQVWHNLQLSQFGVISQAGGRHHQFTSHINIRRFVAEKKNKNLKKKSNLCGNCHIMEFNSTNLLNYLKNAKNGGTNLLAK